MKSNNSSIAVTIDVEDWPQSSWDRSLPIGNYCADNTRLLLDIMSEFPQARATFFVLGKFAEKHPHIIQEIHKAGHEVGSHGWGHVELFHLGQEKFREDLKRSTEIIGNIIGERPIGYRAPDFSIVGETLWALEILSEEGYLYDSSIFPINKPRYGIPTWPQKPVQVKLKSGNTITEFPLTTLTLYGHRLPISGGGYARLLPGIILMALLRKSHVQLDCPPVFYCHPYEFDPQEFNRINIKIPLKVRLHQGIGRKQAASKLQRLLKNFKSISLRSAMAQHDNLAVIDYTPHIIKSGSLKRPSAF